jgi:hypothetical protein
VKLLGDVQLRRQPKNLSKLGDDFLIPVVPKLEQISDTIQVTSLKNPVKMHALLVPQILNIHILLLDH